MGDWGLLAGGALWLVFLAVTLVFFRGSIGLWSRLSDTWAAWVRRGLKVLAAISAGLLCASIPWRNGSLAGLGRVGESCLPLAISAACFGLLFLTARPSSLPSSDRQSLFRVTLALWIGSLVLFFPVIESDGSYYFATGRSLLFDGDLNTYNEAAFHPNGWMESTVRSVGEKGHTFNPFPSGHGLLLIPWILLGELMAGVCNLFGWNWIHDGYSPAVLVSVGLASFCYGLVGAFAVFGFVSDSHSPRIATWATLAAILGSPMVYYIYIQSGFPHALGMMAVAVFLLCWRRARRTLDLTDWLWVGLAGGLATLARWQYALYFLVPVVDLLWDFLARKDPRRGRFSCLAVGSLGFLATVVVQVVVFKVTLGGWTPTGYPPELFDFTRPRVLQVFFGPERGLFSWHPVFLVGLLGVFWSPKGQRRTVLLLGGVFILQAWIIAAYLPGYHGGSGFGNRLFDHAIPLAAIGLAILRTRLAVWGQAWERAFMTLVGVLILWNFLFLCMVLHAPFNEYQPFGVEEVAKQAWNAFAIKFVYHFRTANLAANLLHGVFFREAEWFFFALGGAIVLGAIATLAYRTAVFFRSQEPTIRGRRLAAFGFLGYWGLVSLAIVAGYRNSSTVHAVELAPFTPTESYGLSFRRFHIDRGRSTYQGGLGEIRLSSSNRSIKLAVYPAQTVHSLILNSRLDIDVASPTERLDTGTTFARVSLYSAHQEIAVQDIQVGRETAYPDDSRGLVPVRRWKHGQWDWPIYQTYSRQWTWSGPRVVDEVRLELLPPYPAWMVEGIAFDLAPPSSSWMEYPQSAPVEITDSGFSQISDRFVPIDLAAVAHSDWALDPTLAGITQPGNVPLHKLEPGWIGTEGVPIRILPKFSETGRYSTLTTCFLHGSPLNPVHVPVVPEVSAKRLWLATTGFFIGTDTRLKLVRFTFRYADGSEQSERLRANYDLWDYDRGLFPISNRIWDESNVHHNWGRIALVPIDLEGTSPLVEILIEDPNEGDPAGAVIFGMTLEK